MRTHNWYDRLLLRVFLHQKRNHYIGQSGYHHGYSNNHGSRSDGSEWIKKHDQRHYCQQHWHDKQSPTKLLQLLRQNHIYLQQRETKQNHSKQQYKNVYESYREQQQQKAKDQ